MLIFSGEVEHRLEYSGRGGIGWALPITTKSKIRDRVSQPVPVLCQPDSATAPNPTVRLTKDVSALCNAHDSVQILYAVYRRAPFMDGWRGTDMPGKNRVRDGEPHEAEAQWHVRAGG